MSEFLHRGKEKIIMDLTKNVLFIIIIIIIFFKEIIVHLSASSADLSLCSIIIFLNDLASYKCCQYDI